MLKYNIEKSFIRDVASQLSTKELLDVMFHSASDNVPMPSIKILHAVVDDFRSILFPGYFGSHNILGQNLEYNIGSILDRLFFDLSEQIQRGFCFFCTGNKGADCKECNAKALDCTEQLIKKLPSIRHLLALDAKAAYEGDPAAKSIGETIFCYPSLKAVTNYRIAHELYIMDVPFIPRIISEMAHSETGIDIHPGAVIGEKFFIDHGTGVVIGETCIIGNNVRLYQGVTLGAKSFPLDDSGNPIKGIRRHPIVEDNVVIYSGATILGVITIGKGSQIGGNVWITDDVPMNSKIRANFKE